MKAIFFIFFLTLTSSSFALTPKVSLIVKKLKDKDQPEKHKSNKDLPNIVFIGENIKGNTFDFGKIIQGEAKDNKETRIIKFQNKGKIPFKIKRISTVCGCTVVKQPNPKDIIKPTKQGEFEISYTYKTSDLGVFRKKIRVFYADSRSKNNLSLQYIDLFIQGEIFLKGEIKEK